MAESQALEGVKLHETSAEFSPVARVSSLQYKMAITCGVVFVTWVISSEKLPGDRDLINRDFGLQR